MSTWRLGRWRVGLFLMAFASISASCDPELPLRPVNHSPVVRRLSVFPSLIGPGDSAVVICEATDPEQDTLQFDWTTDCRMIMSTRLGNDSFVFGERSGQMVVHAGACARTPLDTGVVFCHVRDGRGGGVNAGYVRIVVQQ